MRLITSEEVATIVSKITAAAKAPKQDLLDNTYELVTDSGNMELSCEYIKDRLYYKADGKHIMKISFLR